MTYGELTLGFLFFWFPSDKTKSKRQGTMEGGPECEFDGKQR